MLANVLATSPAYSHSPHRKTRSQGTKTSSKIVIDSIRSSCEEIGASNSSTSSPLKPRQTSFTPLVSTGIANDTAQSASRSPSARVGMTTSSLETTEPEV